MLKFPDNWLISWKDGKIPNVFDTDNAVEIKCPHVPIDPNIRHANWIAEFSGQRVKRPQITITKKSDPIHYSAIGQYRWSGRLNVVVTPTGEGKRGYYSFYNGTHVVFQTNCAVALSLDDYNALQDVIKQASWVLNNLRHKP